MTMLTHALGTTSLGETLGAHHRRIARLVADVTGAMRAGNPVEARERWGVLDRELTRHMAFEEEALLPRLAELDPGAARSLAAEHVELRRTLDELGASLDLKQVSEPVATELFDRLGAHAEREDKLLYHWADRTLSDREPLLERLRRALKG